MLSLFGSGIGRGIAIGPAYVLKNSDIEIPQVALAASQVNSEVKRFRAAINSTENTYKALLKGLAKDAPKESAAFINAHMLMLRDPMIMDESIKIIRKEQVNAEFALQTQADTLIKVFEQMEDAYLRAKKADVQHVANRVLRRLLNIVSHNLDEFNDEDLGGRIVVGKDLSPAETMFIKDRKVASFVTDLGSQISHTAIIARSLKMPAVVGLHGSTRYINDNDMLIVDGMRGIIIINPSSKVLREYKSRQSKIRARERELNTLIKKRSQTADSQRVQLLGNIDEQFREYKRIAISVGKPVIIRTLDIGGDKQLDFNYPNKQSSESPLGLRAVRMCLSHIEIFKPQLRAILRASAFGKVSIMIPMVSNFDEINQILTIIKQTKAELKAEGIAHDSRIKVGGMIEVPAAAIMAEAFAQKLDFLSIGTNDLIQYTLAIDRVDDAVNYLYDPMHPAVLQLIKQVIRAGKKADIPVSLCGEMAGNVQYTRLLLGLGLRNFSMDATYLLDVKDRVLNADTTKLRYLVGKIMGSDNPSEARDLLTKLNQI